MNGRAMQSSRSRAVWLGLVSFWGSVVALGFFGGIGHFGGGRQCQGQELGGRAGEPGLDSGGPVRVVDASQVETTVRLLSANERGIEYALDQTKGVRNAEELYRVEISPQRGPADDAMVLTLVDGSRVYGTRLEGKEQAWQFLDSAGVGLRLGAGVVGALQVRPMDGDLRMAWESAVAERMEIDALIVLRPGNTLDRVNGLIREVKDGKVVFDADGQVVEVALVKLAGMVWFRPPLEQTKPTIAIRWIDGGLVYAEKFLWTSERVEVQGVVGERYSFPPERVSSIDYSHANLRWLSSVACLESRSEKRMDWKWENAALERALAPRLVRGRNAADSVAADLLFAGPGSYVFRVPEGFTRLVSKIERTGGGFQRSAVRVEVWLDDVRVLEREMSASDEEIELDVPLASNKKVRLSVLSPGRLKIGTELRWIEPRFLR